MKKSISIRNRKKSRGVAVIFTLGILGLLTVMALGFASTALLNRKIADNTSSADYSRHIAKNIAFARAKNAVMRNAVTMTNYYAMEISGQSTEKDFLHKMDTILDGVELYRVTDGTSFKNDTARWQYVTDPNDNNRILGRYAYAIIPDSGRMDPNVHLGTSADASNRYGYSMQELSIPAGTAESTDWKTSLTGKLTVPDRWRSFSEIFRCLGKDMVSPSADVRNILSDGISLRNSQSPETFWLDLNNDGKRTPEEMFLRFNLTRDWSTTTVDDLIGASSSSNLTINDAGTAKSINFIPWLKYWNHSVGSSWTADVMKKQIAANIIQYNRPGPTDSSPSQTISDQDGDWLTTPPTYAGIGRHPMLNEIGFLVRVKTDVTSEFVSKDDEAGTITYKYTPIFYITVDAGAELIYPFGPAPTGGMFDSEIRFSGTKDDEGTVNNMILKFRLRKFLEDGSPELTSTVADLVEHNNLIDSNGVLNPKMIHNHHDIMVIGSDGEVTKYTSSSTTPVKMDDGGGLKWSNFNLSLKSADWPNRNLPEEKNLPAYTKAGKFWKEGQTEKQQTLKIPIRSFKMTTKTSIGTPETIATAIARRMTIEWQAFTPGHAVLKVSPKDADAYVQRDVVRSLKSQSLPSNSSGQDYKGYDIAGWSGMDKDTEKVWFVAYETTDPLVNHYPTDWEATSTGLLAWSETTSLTNDYPGTLYSSGSESHLNSTISGKLPFNLLPKINGTAIQETATDPAYNPAYTTAKRLSSSYIRHGQMKSLWELSFISRAEAFRTLNLAKVRTFTVGTSAGNRKANTFADGDANILDQVKLSENTGASSDLLYPYGKINLNSTSHRVLEQVFNANVKWFESLRTSTTDGSPFDETDVDKKTTSTAVCSDSSCRQMIPCADPTLCPHKYVSGDNPGCLAHLLLDRSSILPFSNRSDLLVEPTAAELAKLPGYNNLSSDQKNKLVEAQKNLRDWLLCKLIKVTPEASFTDSLCKAEKEQYAARFMNLFCTEPVQHVYIVVLAQSIKDIGGSPVFVDWNGDGEYAPEDEIDFPVSTKGLKSGYVRKSLYSSGYERVGSRTKAKESITTTTVGTYDYGADKITGETKMIVEMTKDVITGKWKIVGSRYVE